MDAERLLNRFLRYVRVDTTAHDATNRYPSSEGQLELGKMLADELKAMGLNDVTHDEFGIVIATLPSNVDGSVPVVAFNSHVDTSPETSGKNVNPQVIRSYSGGDIELLTANQSIRIADNPELEKLIGCTLITTDGSTLLGGDDKAGLAIIMEAVQYLVEHPEIPHGPVRILFTCDEEIGHGVDHVDVPALGATVCYTIDGPGGGQIDVETFSADLATITVQGINIHPAIGKDRMVNALKAAAALVDRLPKDSLSPETTSDREGFLHPYSIEGGVAEVTLRVLLRDFDTFRLAEHADRLRQVARDVAQAIPRVGIDVQVTPQYRNLGDGLAKEPRAADFAEKAFQKLGIPCCRSIIRGGTDGSRLTELGLPTPNLSSGQHNPHSPLEWACLDEMVQSARVAVELVQIWAEEDS